MLNAYFHGLAYGTLTFVALCFKRHFRCHPLGEHFAFKIGFAKKDTEAVLLLCKELKITSLPLHHPFIISRPCPFQLNDFLACLGAYMQAGHSCPHTGLVTRNAFECGLPGVEYGDTLIPSIIHLLHPSISSQLERLACISSR